MSPPSKFVSSEAWLLLAIVYCKTGGTLHDLIATADYLNHAIPTYDELNDGLARLSAASYIKEKNGNYRAKPKVMKAYQRTTTPRRSALKEWGDLQKFLDTTKPPTPLKIKTIITLTEYEATVKEYLKSFS